MIAFRRKAGTALLLAAALAPPSGSQTTTGPRGDSARPSLASAPQSASAGRDIARTPLSFRRDDTSPDHVTTVEIDATQAAGSPIAPEIFGNFIEHLGDVVYPGLWAQTLINPNLEQIDPTDTEPPGWRLLGAAWRDGGWRSPRCVRLTGSAAIEQTISLPIHRTRLLRLSFAARAHAGAVQSVTISLLGAGRKASEIYLNREERISEPPWTLHKRTLTVSPGRIAKGEPVRFRIRHSGPGSVDLDQIELVPADSVAGMDPDVLLRARAWRMPLVRWPGGNFASGYDWRDGIGPHADRPTRRNAAWGGVEPNHFGTDEFLGFCALLGVEPHLTVNAGDGTPREAADWVRYCNSAPSEPWGARRAANGHPAPYGVRLWEVGNELYGAWQIGHAGPAENAGRYVRFRDAMLQADPNLKLIATGKGDEFTGDGLVRNADWNARLLAASVAGGRPAPDYLSIHPLVPLPGSLRGLPYALLYESAMAHPAFLDRQVFPSLGDLIDSIAGAKGHTRIAVTEWGIIVGGERWREAPNHDSEAGAVYNALALNAMLRHTDLVTLANMTAFMHGGGIKKPAGVVIVDPQYYTQQLYAGAGIRTPVAVLERGPGHDVPARGFLPAVSDVPDIDVFAALTADRDALVVFAVNRLLTDSRAFSLRLRGFEPATLSATMLTGKSPADRNSIQNPNNVTPHSLATAPWPASAATPWRVTLPPHSLTVFTLRRPSRLPSPRPVR